MSDLFRNVDTALLTRCLLVACLLTGFAPPAGAVQILHARVTQLEGRYEVDFVVLLSGRPAPLRRLIADYPRFVELSPTVVTSRVLSGDSGGNARIELKLHPCVLVIFCRTIVKVSDATLKDGGRRIEYVAVPALSDFHEAREIVTFEEQPGAGGERVRFHYRAVLKPKFYVPPLVGPWLVRHRIVEDLETTSRRVESILRDEAADHAR